MKPSTRGDVVSAAEIAAWAWRPESWRLDTLGAEPGNQVALARGKAFYTWTLLVKVWSRRRTGVRIRLLTLRTGTA